MGRYVYTEKGVIDAVFDITNGPLSQYQTSEKYGVAQPVLSKRLSGQKSRKESTHTHQQLSPSQDKLLSFLDVPGGLTAKKANEIRTAVTLTESRVDYRGRSFLFLPSSHRIARYRFRQNGLLLPFGASRREFQQPNPTFFQTTDSWPMYDNADPLNGWSLKEVETTFTGLATSDIYGKLYYRIRVTLKTFLERISSLSVAFELLQVDASNLSGHLENRVFDRIEVSNISDGGYLGIHQTVGIMSPLLQAPDINPHATLITLLMNVVDENMTDQDQIADATMHSPSTKRLLKFLPPNHPPTSRYDPDIIKFSYARDFVRTYDQIFKRDKLVRSRFMLVGS
ncbi:hypothetical protein FPOA_12899 [Fusarium poae]|uniref:Uncharacterized protein n=2 Tax=Fusarium poae TaxID=36050 RepID=A0A1B8A7K3_FUSPO|nr:hypothetical protein FPOA_13350 [Fusarium poae]OBS16456.1 hypothetical protein FPOA_12899 [Fusarium poae]